MPDGTLTQIWRYPVKSMAGERLDGVDLGGAFNERLQHIGYGHYDLGARSQQIRDALRRRQKFDEEALYDIQLDDRALYLDPWRQVMAEVLNENDDPTWRGLRHALGQWSGRASIDSVAYRLVRTFRAAVAERALGPLLAAANKNDDENDIDALRCHLVF